MEAKVKSCMERLQKLLGVKFNYFFSGKTGEFELDGKIYIIVWRGDLRLQGVEILFKIQGGHRLLILSDKIYSNAQEALRSRENANFIEYKGDCYFKSENRSVDIIKDNNHNYFQQLHKTDDYYMKRVFIAFLSNPAMVNYPLSEMANILRMKEEKVVYILALMAIKNY